jgi:hypothetical protein
MRRSALLLAALVSLFLAGIGGGTTAVARLSVNPPLLGHGATVIIKGTGFAPKVNVTINVRRPDGPPTVRWATLKAGSAGGFRYVKAISRSADPGKYVVIACQRACRVRATASFRIVKLQPV